MIYLLDTDTVIYWLKGNQTISQKVVAAGFHSVGISDISRAELYYGAHKSKRVNENLASVKALAERVNFIPFNEPAQVFFGKTKTHLEKMGTRLDDMDLMIASTALAFDLVLITNNLTHFDRVPDLKAHTWI